jgi:hypothetical protein
MNRWIESAIVASALLLAACLSGGALPATVLRDPATPGGARSPLVTTVPAVTGAASVGTRVLDPRALRVTVVAVDVGATVPGLRARLEPSLAPGRDAMAVRLRATIADNWKRATRGLGSLAVTSTGEADLAIYVLPGRGSSFHVAKDGSASIGLFVVGDLGDSPEYFDMSALHELGHSWCCFGPDAGPDGHWSDAVEDPGLVATDRFGLMTYPVACLVRSGTVVRCPRFFSERELRTMGFTDIPAAPADLCGDESTALKVQLAVLDASLAASFTDVENARTQFAIVARQVQDIEATYPNGALPPDVRNTYVGLLARYDALRSAGDAKIDALNTSITARNGIIAQIIALPC